MKRRRGSCSGRMGLARWRTVLMVVVAALQRVSVAESQCPVECSCLGNTVICKDLQLVGAPNGLPPWTQNLILKGNNFANLEFTALLNLPKLEELDVNSNVLVDNFTLSLSDEAQLKWLKVNKNRLSRVPELGLPHLAHLTLAHNTIGSLDKGTLHSYPELQYLDLSGNRLRLVQNGSFSAPKLKGLYLNSNQIASIESNGFDGLATLQELRLNKNRLASLKDYLKRLDKLRVLELNRNEIRQIEALTFKDMRSLEKLRLRRNRIESLKAGAFWQLSNLTELQLDYNSLAVVSKGALFGLDRMQLFSLSHNRIASVDQQAWEMCANLVELDLSHNELSRVERATFASLRKLRKLRLDHNGITYIAEGAFKDLASLQQLELNSNKISYIVEDAIGIFAPLGQLQKLGLAHNQIKTIHKNAFGSLSQLAELDLTGNNVTSIQENAFASMAASLSSLKMNSSALFCDCGLQWFGVWLRGKQYGETRVQCGYPHWLRDVPLTQLHDANFTCDSFPKPRIVEEPQSQLSIKGDKATLRCRATSTADAPLSFTWKHDNLELRDRSLQTDDAPSSADGVTVATSLLQLDNVTNAHGGKYQCMVSNNYGTTYSSKARISVLVYPTFSKIPHDIRVAAGSTARLECSAEGLPPPQIAWQKDGGNDFPAARERRMHKMPTDDVLFIIDAKTADSGVYSCTAQNTAGVVAANATLTILETPSFAKPMENKEVMAGGSIVLECMAGGSPRPQLAWRKNGSPLQATERHFFTAENQLLIIVNAVAGDAGSYECEMSNSLGSVVGASLLAVKAAPSSSVLNEDDVLGLIIITVVCCAVGTSVVWVVIIYQTRRRLNATQTMAAAPAATETQLYLDTSSQHSKDSGTGDSTNNPSSDRLCLPGEAVRCAVSNEEDAEGDDPLLRYTNHERHSMYDQLRHECEVDQALAKKPTV